MRIIFLFLLWVPSVRDKVVCPQKLPVHARRSTHNARKIMCCSDGLFTTFSGNSLLDLRSCSTDKLVRALVRIFVAFSLRRFWGVDFCMVVWVWTDCAISQRFADAI